MTRYLLTCSNQDITLIQRKFSLREALWKKGRHLRMLGQVLYEKLRVWDVFNTESKQKKGASKM